MRKRAAVLIPAMIWGAKFGIFGVAVAQMIVTGASTVLNLVVAGRILALPTMALIGEFKTAATGCAVMIAALLLAQPLLAGLPGAAALMAEIAIGTISYLGTVAAIDRPAMRQVRAAFASTGAAA